MERVSRNIVFDKDNIIVPKSNDDKVAPYIWKDPEIPKMNIKDEIKWREEEIKRWRDGYNGLTGSHYFLLSQCFVKLPTGKTIRPWWRDWDAALHEQYTIDQKKGNTLYVFKRRRFALSTIFGGSEPLRLALINPGSVSAFTSCDVKRGNEMFYEKLTVAFDNFDKRWNITNLSAKDLKELEANNGVRLPEWTVFKKDVGSRSGTKIRIDFLKKELNNFFTEGDEGGESKELSYSLQPTGDVSQIAYAQTSRRPADAAALEGQSLIYAFLDEFFLHPFANKVKSATEASLSEGFIRTGMFVTGGSCGEMSVQGIANARKVIQEHGSPASKTSVFFIPGSACIERAPEYDDNGEPTGGEVNFMYGTSRVEHDGTKRYAYSDQEKAKEWILKTRENLQNLADPVPFRQFVKSYPLTLDEVLEAGAESLLSKDIMECVIKQKNIIMNDKNKREFYEHTIRERYGKISLEVLKS